MTDDRLHRLQLGDRRRATHIVEVGVEHRDDRLRRHLAQRRERRAHLLDALTGVDRDDAARSAHKRLIREAVAHQRPGVLPEGVELATQTIGVGQQRRVDHLTGGTLRDVSIVATDRTSHRRTLERPRTAARTTQSASGAGSSPAGSGSVSSRPARNASNSAPRSSAVGIIASARRSYSRSNIATYIASCGSLATMSS